MNNNKSSRTATNKVRIQNLLKSNTTT